VRARLSQWSTFLPSGGRLVVMALYLGVAVASFLYGWHYAQVGFTSPPTAGQAYATVFVQNAAATPTLWANIDTTAPWADYLEVKAPKHAKWLVVIQCPPGRQSARRPIYLTTEAPPQALAQAPSSPTVTVRVGEGSSPGHIDLNCFSSLRPGQAAPGIQGVTLPALETDQAIGSIQSSPTLYVEHNGSGDLTGLFQVFPGAICPQTATPAAIPSSPSPGGSASASPSPGGSASATPAASPSPSASPSPTAGPPTPAIPACFAPQASFSPYYLPASVTTHEILQHVNLTGYVTDSIFPSETTKSDNRSDEQFTWNGTFGLSPSIEVTNQASQDSDNRAIFQAGVAFGVCAAVAVGFFDKLFEAIFDFRKEWKKQKKRKEGNPGPPSGDPPSGDPPSGDPPSGSQPHGDRPPGGQPGPDGGVPQT